MKRNLVTIQSRTNPIIKQVASLQQNKYRKQYGQFLAEGLNVVSALIASGMQPVMLYVTEQYLDAFGSEKNITLVTDLVMQKLSSAQTPSGVMGVFEIPTTSKKLAQSGLVLATISDPGNMGTLIRSAAAFGTKSVVIVGGADVWSPKVIQATAGTIGLVTIHQLNWADLIKQKPNLCALVVHGGKSPEKINLKNYFLVVGSEAHGLSPEQLADCQEKLTLPMTGNTESLNAAVAGSIALYLSQ
jgi:TrmH family RNA methyltransferase